MSKTPRRYLALFTVAACFVVGMGSQSSKAQSSTPDYQLNVSGEVERSLKLGPSDLAKLPRRSVKATDPGGAEATFEGIALADILQLAEDVKKSSFAPSRALRLGAFIAVCGGRFAQRCEARKGAKNFFTSSQV